MDDAGNTPRDRGRITVALTPGAAAALGALRGRTGLTGTSLVNRAITLYELAEGREVLIREPGGTVRQVMFL